MAPPTRAMCLPKEGEVARVGSRQRGRLLWCPTASSAPFDDAGFESVFDFARFFLKFLFFLWKSLASTLLLWIRATAFHIAVPEGKHCRSRVDIIHPPSPPDPENTGDELGFLRKEATDVTELPTSPAMASVWGLPSCRHYSPLRRTSFE